ncbi:hypothetical protein BH23GEM4_BH23GEM4_14040 [soil metagenome]
MSEATLHFPLELRELDTDFEFVRELGRGGAAVVYPDARPATAEAFLAELADASPTANLRRWRSPSVWRRWFTEAAAQRDSAPEGEPEPSPPVAEAPTVRYRSEDEEGEASAPKAEVEAEPAPPLAAPRRAVAWLRDQLILPQAVWGSEGAVTRAARFAAEVIAAAELERLDLRKHRAAAREEREKELVRRRAEERERQEFIDSLRIERAGPDRHPDWDDTRTAASTTSSFSAPRA